MKEWRDEQLEWGMMFVAVIVDIVTTLVQMVREFGPRLMRVVWKATLHPEDEREWRAVWIWFWVSIIYLILIAIVTWALMSVLPAPLNVIATWIWLVYTLFCEPMAYFVYGKGFEARERYVETGELVYDTEED